ncbi:MAG TPA: 5-methyltetrahydropteroyltriglutamate--homocysteine S-methyltransferase, partial [Gammaproteobacteria bacterium]|nr:5-methyltetrahydropteroyltriglutamate--homocysteine S-methyltransferase [Gammaproteobacteria bacterium]
MVITHHLGFPRIGIKRDLKWALERYWKGEINQEALMHEGKRIRDFNWNLQLKSGMDFLAVGDFAWYDHVLETSTLLGVIPERFQNENGEYNLDTYFRMARGRAPTGKDTHALEMTKWFDTNYHYMVPEFQENQTFKITNEKLFSEIEEAKLLGNVKPILLGPLSYLWLGKEKENFDKLTLLKKLTNTYTEILTKIRDLGVQWVQIDEPILVL